MNYWIIADTHFGHDKIAECFGRPKDFEIKIFKALKIIKPQDVLIHLGDFCIGEDRLWHDEFMSKCLATRKWLVKGNHDRKSISWYLNRGWDCVTERLQLTIYGKTTIFSHKPLPLGDFDINIHGHLHTNGQHHHPELNDHIEPHNILIAVEHDYRPVTLRSIIEPKRNNGKSSS